MRVDELPLDHAVGKDAIAQRCWALRTKLVERQTIMKGIRLAHQNELHSCIHGRIYLAQAVFALEI
eukprot:1448543-Prymnesium_polylepis.1